VAQLRDITVYIECRIIHERRNKSMKQDFYLN